MNFDDLDALENVAPGPFGSTELKKRAYELHRSILGDCDRVVQSLRSICVNLSLIKDDNLYTLLGYTTFRLYVEGALNFSYPQARKYYSVGLFIRELERRSEKSQADYYSLNVQNFCDLGIEKMYILASCSDAERSELARSTDFVQISKRDLKKDIKKLRGDFENKDSLGYNGSISEYRQTMAEATKEHNLQVDEAEDPRADESEIAEAEPPPISESLLALVQMLKQMEGLVTSLKLFYRDEENEKKFGDLEFRHYLRRLDSSLIRDLKELEKFSDKM